MTRKDFVLIASVLKRLNDSEKNGWEFDVYEAFADALSTTNVNFDKGRFLVACGVEQ